MLLAAAMTKFMSSLTVSNLLKNNLDKESANMLVSVAQEKQISLCGISPEQTDASFSGWGLKPIDAILIAHDLGVRASLTSLG